MTLIETPNQYRCDRCGKTAEAPAENRGYPDGWGIYEHYPEGGAEIVRGDLCDDCMKLILPEEKK